MRIFAQDQAFCRKVRVDLGGHPEAARRFELLQQVERARGHGLTLKASLSLLGLARRRRHARSLRMAEAAVADPSPSSPACRWEKRRRSGENAHPPA